MTADWVKAWDERDARAEYLRKQAVEQELKAERELLFKELADVGRVFENEDPRLAAGFHVEERAAISAGFGQALGEVNRGIRNAAQARWKILDDQYFAVRHMPTSQASQNPGPKNRMKLEVKGWAHGEVIRSNDVWFQLAAPFEGWVHSGEFRPEERNVGNLPEVTIYWGTAYDHPGTCTCDTCLPIRPDKTVLNEVKLRLEQSHFGSAIERTFATSPTYADKYERTLRKQVEEKHRATRIPKGAKLLPPETEAQREALREVERQRQAKMGYRVGPHPWLPGYRVIVDRHDGKKHEFWRPTKASAERTGHQALERFVRRRQRAFEAANPRLVTARDRWIIEPTQAEQTAKEQAEWDAQFNEGEKQ